MLKEEIMGEETFSLSEPVFRDFCPLCGSRFLGGTPEEVIKKIIDHMDSGYCEQHFVPWEVALRTDCYEKATGKVF